MRVLLAFVAFVGLASPGFAHRLDEYLIATTIAVEEEHVSLRLRLTPGVDVAGTVFAAMDIDCDGRVSDAERHAYAERVRSDLSLVIDGQAQVLQLLSVSFPQDDTALRRGSGSIAVDFAADVRFDGTKHTLTLSNRHQQEIAVYLVNTLRPRDAAVTVLDQERNYRQSSYRLDFTVDRPTPQTMYER
jgi:hypothetical protein